MLLLVYFKNYEILVKKSDLLKNYGKTLRRMRLSSLD
jgi:hypothetical protein